MTCQIRIGAENMLPILHELQCTAVEELARALSYGGIQASYSGLALREWLAGYDQARGGGNDGAAHTVANR